MQMQHQTNRMQHITIINKGPTLHNNVLVLCCIYLFFDILSRLFLSKYFLRKRIVSGVTSQYSSSLKYLIASSNDMDRVLRIMEVWSLCEERILVKYFLGVIFTVKSFLRLCSLSIIPA